jgi:hypothetical protein
VRCHAAPGVYQATVAEFLLPDFLPRSAPACLSHGRRHFFHDVAGVEHSVGLCPGIRPARHVMNGAACRMKKHRNGATHRGPQHLTKRTSPARLKSPHMGRFGEAVQPVILRHCESILDLVPRKPTKSTGALRGASCCVEPTAAGLQRYERN